MMPKTGRTTLMRASMGRTAWVGQQSNAHTTEPAKQDAIVRGSLALQSPCPPQANITRIHSLGTGSRSKVFAGRRQRCPSTELNNVENRSPITLGIDRLCGNSNNRIGTVTVHRVGTEI